MRDERNAKGGMRDKNTSTGKDLLIFTGVTRVSFKIDSGMQDRKLQVKD